MRTGLRSLTTRCGQCEPACGQCEPVGGQCDPVCRRCKPLCNQRTSAAVTVASVAIPDDALHSRKKLLRRVVGRRHRTIAGRRGAVSACRCVVRRGGDCDDVVLCVWASTRCGRGIAATGSSISVIRPEASRVQKFVRLAGERMPVSTVCGVAWAVCPRRRDAVFGATAPAVGVSARG